MTEGVIVALITGGLAIISNVIVSVFNNSKTVWRIEQLEAAMKKHNNLIERIVAEEQNTKAQWRCIDELREEIEGIKK